MGGVCIYRSFFGRPRHKKVNHALTRGKFRPGDGQTQYVTLSVNLCFSSSIFFLHIFYMNSPIPSRHVLFLCVLFILFLKMSHFLFGVCLCLQLQIMRVHFLLVIGILSGPLVSTSRFDFATFIITSVRVNSQLRVGRTYQLLATSYHIYEFI